MFKRTISFISTAAMVASMALPMVTHATVTNSFNAGSLIKGSRPAVYYFAENGKRYVFPNEKTYFSWYKNFNGVIEIPDNVLSTIPIGGNVTYRPGVKMVKITTDPKVYAVDRGGILRWVATEQLAKTLYNINWANQIDDIPDAFFINYRIGTAINTAEEFTPVDVTNQTSTISMDKGFDESIAAISIGNTNTGFVPSTITIKRGATVTWTNQDSATHRVVGSGFESPVLKYGETYQRTFNQTGSFEYTGGTGDSMTGAINVVP